MTITPKPQDQKNKKHETLKRLFGLASKVFGFPCVFFCLFDFEMHKVYGWRKSPKTKKKFFAFQNQTKNKKNTRKKQKKHLLRLNQKVSSKFWFFGFSFWGFGVIVILYILQAFRYTKMTNRVYIIYVCVSYIYIYMYVCLEGHDTRGFEVYLRGLQYIYIYTYI